MTTMSEMSEEPRGVYGTRTALWVGVGGMVGQAILLHRSAFRHARLTAAA